MPIYEFICAKCKNEFELRFSFVQTDCTTLCPKCLYPAQRLTSSFACKTGGNIQAAEKAFRKEPAKTASTSIKRASKKRSRPTKA
jgi:putative FmdB family regulatory protein